MKTSTSTVTFSGRNIKSETSQSIDVLLVGASYFNGGKSNDISLEKELSS